MHGFAGVAVLRAGLVLLVQEPDFFSGEPCWTMPSGRVEDGETPGSAAVRELAEESGCVIDPADLELFAVTEVQHQGTTISTSWNFTAATTRVGLGSVVPDVLVTDARWFEPADAIDLLSWSSYAPKREPFLRFLKSGEHGLRWSFELVDPSAHVPTFVWDAPLSGQLASRREVPGPPAEPPMH